MTEPRGSNPGVAQPHGDATFESAPASSPDPLEERLREALEPGLVVVRLIGEGGMARVYLAREPALRRLVAVKVLSGELANNPEARARFEREAQAVAGLAHPNIVAIHAVGELADGTPYFVMQYVPGRSMAARLEEEGPLAVAEVRRIIGDVASALAYAHSQGVVHRDIKPANVLYDDLTGRALVSDFGIAAVMPSHEPTAVRLTGTGILLGTPKYMSPEQLLAEPVSEKSDVYALGLLAHELLAGEGPFRGKTPQELIAAHLRDVPRRLSSIRQEVDAELDELVARCLDKDAGKRPTAEEIARRLAPGQNAMLEWPPPGLDGLRGTLGKLSESYWIGALLTLSFLVPVLLAGSQLAATSLPVLLSVLAVAGLACLGLALRRTTLLGRQISGALRAGYGWFTILETMVDVESDGGALIVGSREFASVSASNRSRLRMRRVLAGLLFLGSGVLVLPMVVIVMALAGAGHAAEGALWVVLGIAFLAVAIGVAIKVAEASSFAGERNRRRRSAAATDVAKLSVVWYGLFERARDGQSLGRGASTPASSGWSSALATLAVVTLTMVLLLPIIGLQAVAPMYFSIAVPDLPRSQWALQMAAVTRGFDLEKDARITPLEGGRALDAIYRTGGPRDRTRFIQNARPDVGTPPWSKPLPKDAFVGLRSTQYVDMPDPTRVFAAASAGFSRPEAAYLETLAHAPQWRILETLARAPRADYYAARYVLPFAPRDVGWWDMPTPRYQSAKRMALAGVLRAAFYLSKGQRDSAELTLRMIVSAGDRMIDDGVTLLDELMGAVVVGIGRQGLIDYFKAVHDPRGAALAARRDSLIAMHDRDAEVGASDRAKRASGTQPAELRPLFESAARDRQRTRGTRSEALRQLAIAPCTNVHELVFGPDQDVRDAFAEARRNWVRLPSDPAVLDLMEETPRRLISYVPDVWWAHAAMAGVRATSYMLRNDRIAGCSALALAWLGRPDV